VNGGGIDVGGGEVHPEMRVELRRCRIAPCLRPAERSKGHRRQIGRPLRRPQCRLVPRRRRADIAVAVEQFAAHHHSVEVGAVEPEKLVERGVRARPVVELEIGLGEQEP
jgi:ribosomal protein L31E